MVITATTVTALNNSAVIMISPPSRFLKVTLKQAKKTVDFLRPTKSSFVLDGLHQVGLGLEGLNKPICIPGYPSSVMETRLERRKPTLSLKNKHKKTGTHDVSVSPDEGYVGKLLCWK